MVEVIARGEIGSGGSLLLHDWLSLALTHDELLLDKSLGIDWTVGLLLSATLGHIGIGTGVELLGCILHAQLVEPSLLEVLGVARALLPGFVM